MGPGDLPEALGLQTQGRCRQILSAKATRDLEGDLVRAEALGALAFHLFRLRQYSGIGQLEFVSQGELAPDPQEMVTCLTTRGAGWLQPSQVRRSRWERI